MRVFAVTHRSLAASTKFMLDDDCPWGICGELYYFVGPVLPTSRLELRLFHSGDQGELFAMVQAWLVETFGATAVFDELVDDD